MSFFLSSVVTPKSVLMRPLNMFKGRAESDNKTESKSGTQWLKQNGSTVDEMLARGWLVVALTLDVFVQLGFELPAVESDGHFCVKGSEDDFLKMGDDLADLSIVVLAKTDRAT